MSYFCNGAVPVIGHRAVEWQHINENRTEVEINLFVVKKMQTVRLFSETSSS